jgi:Mg-chelatase subunit ChlD
MDPIDMNPVSNETRKIAQANVSGGYDMIMDGHFSAILKDAIAEAGKPLSNAEDYGRFGPSFARLASEAQKASNLRQQCARVLKRADKDSWQRRLSAGRLDRRAYARIGAGDHANPYARHTFSPGYETELTIILDGSDSMSNGVKLERATALAIVVAQAAEQVGVKCELVRFVGHKVVMLKAPRERLSNPAVRQRLAVAASSTSGSTPLTQSIALCAKRLLVRAPTKRKMIFAITDGACDCGKAGVQKIAKYCDENGVEIVGLSIDSQVQGAFRFEAQIDSSDDVSKAGLGVLVKALENRPGFAQ